jgi:hypothetical protein
VQRYTPADDASIARLMDDIDQADEEMIGRLDAVFRRLHPEVFDRRARLRRRVVQRRFERRFGGCD